jgi:hypothetical protein
MFGRELVLRLIGRNFQHISWLNLLVQVGGFDGVGLFTARKGGDPQQDGVSPALFDRMTLPIFNGRIRLPCPPDFRELATLPDFLPWARIPTLLTPFVATTTQPFRLTAMVRVERLEEYVDYVAAAVCERTPTVTMSSARRMVAGLSIQLLGRMDALFRAAPWITRDYDADKELARLRRVAGAG